MQLVVNVTYGIAVAIGLFFIGVPNAILWGAFATVLRFIPYIGPWIAAAFPIILSLAVSPSWTMPLLTLGLFVVLELIMQQRRGALALRLEHRGFFDRAHRRRGLLDLAVGTDWTRACDAAHGLSRRHGAARSTAGLSQRHAQR